MSVDLSQCLVIGISSRALFSLEQENTLFENSGVEVYCDYQRQHENEILGAGVGFPLVRALFRLNKLVPDKQQVEVVIISRNNHDTGLRILNSAKHYGLDITRSAFTSGAPVAKYLSAFNVNLFLSASPEDVQKALDCKIAAGYIGESFHDSEDQDSQIRIAFDGDAVIFSDEAEAVYQNEGLDAFMAYEAANAQKPLPEGPFAVFLKKLAYLQSEFPVGHTPIRTALVTARNCPAHERVIRTLRAWNIRIDETFFMGGVSKDKILAAFRPHIYFDDHPKHCSAASKVVPTARVLSHLHQPK